VALRSARSDIHQLGRTWHRAASRDVRGQNIALARGCSAGTHAVRAAADDTKSIGVQLIMRKRGDC
jgi:hypothetical protein